MRDAGQGGRFVVMLKDHSGAGLARECEDGRGVDDPLAQRPVRVLALARACIAAEVDVHELCHRVTEEGFSVPLMAA
jgi:hypothetical protein